MGQVVLTNVWKRYGKVEAVKDLNLECREGEFLALLGPSGCGKTSTLRMVAGLERISEGEITIDGRRVNEMEPRERNIAMAFEAYALYPHLTLYENIAFPLRVRRFSPAETDRLVRQVADVLQITDVLAKRPAQCSGGQQQRTSFARALVRPASVYLMDEPLSHLDAKQRSQLRSELKRLHHLKGLTIIFVTHDQIEAMAMADRVAVMDLGVLQQVGTPDDVFSRPSNRFVADFVGEPPMNFLACSMRPSDGHVRLASSLFSTEVELVAPARAGGGTGAGPRPGPGQALDVWLGVRPMHVTVSPEHTADSVAAGRVYVVENLGDLYITTVRVGETMVRSESAEEPGLRPDQTVWLSFDRQRIHLFNRSTGTSLYSVA